MYRRAYHGCSHRACPQCGHLDAGEWIERQAARLLPVTYFLITFTVPSELRSLIRSNQRVMLDLLFLEKDWVVHSEAEGSGKPALTYLSRYIYRTAISSERNLQEHNGIITFHYRDSKTREQKVTRLPVLAFLAWLPPGHTFDLPDPTIELTRGCSFSTSFPSGSDAFAPMDG